MDGTQRVSLRRSTVSDAFGACAPALLSSLLLCAACTAEITGGSGVPAMEGQVFAGAAAPASGSVAGVGATAGAPGPASKSVAGARSMSDDGSSVGVARSGAMEVEGTGGHTGGFAGAPASMASMAMGAAGAGSDMGMPQAGSGGSNEAGAIGDAGMMPDEPDVSTEPAMQSEIIAGGVRWLGRVDDRDPNAARFSWAGSGFAAVVQGSTVSVRLSSQGSSIFYQSVIDGTPEERFEVKVGDHTVTLASGLSDGPHTVEVYRDTEGDGPVSIFRGFEAGTLLGAPRPSGRFFEVVGDSITAGYGSLGSERHGSNAGPGCGANAGNSSWFHTYSSVAARELDAEVSALARSGFGMVRGYGQNMNVMPPLFDDTLAGSNNPPWNFEHQPQAVIINLGTNDWNGGDPGVPYENAYIAFVTEVRKRYPDAWILLTVGSSLEPSGARECLTRLGHIVDARMQAGDDKIDSFDIGLQDSSMTGCGWHPNAAEHMRMGMVLADELRSRLSW